MRESALCARRSLLVISDCALLERGLVGAEGRCSGLQYVEMVAYASSAGWVSKWRSVVSCRRAIIMLATGPRSSCLPRTGSYTSAWAPEASTWRRQTPCVGGRGWSSSASLCGRSTPG